MTLDHKRDCLPEFQRSSDDGRERSVTLLNLHHDVRSVRLRLRGDYPRRLNRPALTIGCTLSCAIRIVRLLYNDGLRGIDGSAELGGAAAAARQLADEEIPSVGIRLCVLVHLDVHFVFNVVDHLKSQP